MGNVISIIRIIRIIRIRIRIRILSVIHLCVNPHNE
jgi:hypothetical protein